MLTIGNPAPGLSSTPQKSIALSVLLHGVALVLIALALHRRPAFVAPYKLPGNPNGTNFVVAYVPNRPPEQSVTSSKAQPAHSASPQSHLTAPSTPALPAAANTRAMPDPNASSGADALGSGNITIALTSFFPPPKPDLTQLPPGTRGDVILDVTIGTDGHISDIKMLSGLGHGVDETVIATVQQWVFHPALQDGHPVASEQELRFHYTRG